MNHCGREECSPRIGIHYSLYLLWLHLILDFAFSPWRWFSSWQLRCSYPRCSCTNLDGCVRAFQPDGGCVSDNDCNLTIRNPQHTSHLTGPPGIASCFPNLLRCKGPCPVMGYSIVDNPFDEGTCATSRRFSPLPLLRSCLAAGVRR